MQREASAILKSLQKDIAFYQEQLKEVVNELMGQKFTQFPIFIAHEIAVDVGEMIIDKDEIGTHWSINVSTLEEFLEKSLIQQSKAAEFKAVYKNPKTHFCIFLISEKGGNFIFIPYRKTEGEQVEN